MSTCWNCAVCGLTNNVKKAECQACFNVKPKSQKTIDYKLKQSVLISGFCKQYYSINIAEDIIMIIVAFYNMYYRSWIIANASTYSPQFMSVQGVHFEIDFNNGSFFIKLLSTDIEYVDIVLIFRCNETNTEWRKTESIRSEPLYWPHHLLLTEEYSDRKQYKQLTLSCDIDILYISYYGMSPYVKKIRINPYNEKMQFKWKIDDDLLNQFKICRNGKIFYAPNNFGDGGNFCVWCAPNGILQSNKGYFMLFVKLLALPYDLENIFVDYTLKLKSKQCQIQSSGQTSLSFQSGGNLSWPQDTLLTSKMTQLSSVVFLVTIQIIQSNKW